MRWKSIGRIWGALALFAGVMFVAGFASEPSAGEELPTITFRGEVQADRLGGPADAQGARLARAKAQVDIRDFKYLPKTLEVAPGTEVEWTNFDTAEHSATDIGGDFDTGLFPQGESRKVKLSEPGTYRYICSIHPEMRASVVVSGNGGSGGGGNGSGSGGEDSTGGVSPNGESPATSSGTDSDTGTDTGTGFGTDSGTGSFSSGTSAADGELPMTGFNALWPFVLAALLASAGLLLAALAAHLRPPG
jgi:plastocyanin